jgi:hypothetical protein
VLEEKLGGIGASQKTAKLIVADLKYSIWFKMFKFAKNKLFWNE